MPNVYRGCCSDALRWMYEVDDVEKFEVALMIGLAMEAQFRAVLPCPISPRCATGQTHGTNLVLFVYMYKISTSNVLVA